MNNVPVSDGRTAPPDVELVRLKPPLRPLARLSLPESRMRRHMSPTRARRVAISGALIFVGGMLTSGSPQGKKSAGFWLLVGLVAMAAVGVRKFRIREDERRDRADADALRASLSAGPSTASGETGLVDGVPVEVLSFYAIPTIVRQGFFAAWGSPLAWMATVVANLGFWRVRKRQEREAAAQWRDPEAATLSVTTGRYFLSGRTPNWSSIDIPWERMQQIGLERDGVVIVLTDMPERPLKVKSGNPAWHYALLEHFSRARTWSR